MTSAVEIVPARAAGDYAMARALFEEYAAQLDVDLCFQNFASELERLPEMYGKPSGALLLARQRGKPCGCVGVRFLAKSVCEMKRLYVRDDARGLGVGRALARAAMAEAKALGYERMVLDTLSSMVAARGLYASLGFVSTPAYYDNPSPEAEYLERSLADLS